MKYQSEFNLDQSLSIDFDKMNGLVPAIVQDNDTHKVLMLGYMNREAYQKTLDDGFVYFYSRSRQKLWKKGETSGNFLKVKECKADCDQDALLVKTEPYGNTCHTGNYSCFGESCDELPFLYRLEKLIQDRREKMPEGSYTTHLFEKGISKISQKVGEEAVELIIEAKDNNKALFLNESADLIYHFLVLLAEKGTTLDEVVQVLKSRHSR